MFTNQMLPKPNNILLNTNLGSTPLFRRGKVRDVYDLGDQLLIVATDRISAFDCILPNGIPDKGSVLTSLSIFWFEHLSDLVPNHFITNDTTSYPKELQPYSEQLVNRSMLVKRTKAIPVECVARGYLSGSAWKEYKLTGQICDIKLPKNLEENSQLPEPIFTPATKAEHGHDENISKEQLIKIVGTELAQELEILTLLLYTNAFSMALQRGIIICDTKFEFGILNEKLILIDEVLTPDSSRFWLADAYIIGQPQYSFDKQYVRNYLEDIKWNKQPPAPELPQEIVLGTRERYVQIYEQITGKIFR